MSGQQRDDIKTEKETTEDFLYGSSALLYGDCLARLAELSDNSVDMILCDLPYGTTKCKWDVLIPFEDLWRQYHRVAKKSAAIVLFGTEPFSSHLRLSNLTDYKYDLYWEKERLVNIMQVKKRFGKTVETISVFYKNQCTYNPQMIIHTGALVSNRVKDGVLGALVDGGTLRPTAYSDTGYRYPTQVLKYQRDILKSNLHPTQKPIALLEMLIRTFSSEGQVVLDSCMGSGSTAIAAINTGRDFTGIEKDAKFYSIARHRISNHLGETK